MSKRIMFQPLRMNYNGHALDFQPLGTQETIPEPERNILIA
jgi:hypothetical protein